MTTSRDVDWKAGFTVGSDWQWHLIMDKPYQREVHNLINLSTISLCGLETEFMVFPDKDIWKQRRTCRGCLALDLQNTFFKEGFLDIRELKTLEEIRSTPYVKPSLLNFEPLSSDSLRISDHYQEPLFKSLGLMEYRPNYAVVSNQHWHADYTTSFSIEEELPKPDPIEVPDVNNDQVYGGLMDRARQEIKGYSGRRKLIDRARTRKMRWESERMFADMWKRTMAPDSAETRDVYAEFDREWRERHPSPMQMIVRLWKKVFGWLKR